MSPTAARWARKISQDTQTSTCPQKAALYARRSSPIGENYSIEGQLTELREAAAVRGLAVVDEYVDAGLSGATADRPEYQRLLRDAAAGRFDTVLVWKIDRFSRSILTLLADLNFLKQHGVHFVATTQPVDTSTPSGEFMLTLLGALAQMERATLAERFALGRERRAASGRYWGRPPYGYRYDGDGHLIPDEVEAPIVKLIFDRYILPDQSLMTITAQLNDWGIPTRTGKQWGTDRVWRILISPTYTGEAYVHRVRSDGSYRPTNEWIHVDIPPIVSTEAFEQVQQLLSERRHDRIRGKHEILLRGILRCGRCGARMIGHCDERPFRTRQRGKLYGPYRYSWYKCMTPILARREQRLGRPPRECDSRTWPAEYLEQAVWSHVTSVLEDAEVLEAAVRSNLMAEARLNEIEITAAECTSRLVQLRSERARVISLRTRAIISEAELLAELGRLDEETQKVTSRLQSAETEMTWLRAERSQYDRVSAVLRELKTPDDTAAFPERRAWLLSLIGEVTISSQGGVTLFWHIRQPEGQPGDSTWRFTTSFKLVPIQRYASPSSRPARYHLVNFSLNLNEQLKNRLQTLAQTRGITESDVLREAAAAFLDQEKPAPELPGPFPYARGFGFPRDLAIRIEERARDIDRPASVVLRAALMAFANTAPADQHGDFKPAIDTPVSESET